MRRQAVAILRGDHWKVKYAGRADMLCPINFGRFEPITGSGRMLSGVHQSFERGSDMSAPANIDAR
jgi:hypothetical protein